MKKVRMLVDKEVDGVKYKPNNLVLFADNVAKALVDAGEADSSKPAVAYCEGELGLTAIEHVAAADAVVADAVDKLEAELVAVRSKHRRAKDGEVKAGLAKRMEELEAALAAAQPKAEK